MSQIFNLPDVGEGLTEAEILTWKVSVGSEVSINDVLVEIETAKSVVELPSPYTGTVEKILVSEGETIEVGTPIIAISGSAASTADEPQDALAASVVKTGRLIVAHEAPTFGGMGGELAAAITERCFYSLQAPVLRVGGYYIPYPVPRTEDEYVPDIDRILEAVDRSFEY